LGAPVFADGSSGIDVLIGRTGGYLYGFIIAAWLSACGITHLSQSIGLANALQYGLYPFLLGAMIKIVAGAFIVTLLKYIGAQRTIYSVTTKST